MRDASIQLSNREHCAHYFIDWINTDLRFSNNRIEMYNIPEDLTAAVGEY